jgi:hypothetical protein
VEIPSYGTYIAPRHPPPQPSVLSYSELVNSEPGLRRAPNLANPLQDIELPVRVVSVVRCYLFWTGHWNSSPMFCHCFRYNA